MSTRARKQSRREVFVWGVDYGECVWCGLFWKERSACDARVGEESRGATRADTWQDGGEMTGDNLWADGRVWEAQCKRVGKVVLRGSIWPTSCKGQGEERAAGGAVEQPRITKLIFFWTTLVQSPSCKYKVLNPSASYPGIEMLIGMSQRFTRQIVRGRCVAGFSTTAADQTTHSSPDRLILTKWQMQWNSLFVGSWISMQRTADSRKEEDQRRSEKSH